MRVPSTTPNPQVTRRIGIAVVTLGLLVGAAGCGKSGDKEATPADKTTTSAEATTTTEAGTSTTAPPTTTTSASGTGTTDTTIPDDQNPEGGLDTSDLDTLPSGTHYGYLKGITTGVIESQAVSVVGFDKVQFLTGQAAADAAHKAGDLPPDETSVPNDYYIVNDNPLVRQLGVIPDAQVSIISPAGDPTPKPSSITDAVATAGLYKIIIVNVRGVSTITSVEGVYLP